MNIALVVPGGVDRSGVCRVIPALLALIRRLAAHHELHVFALHQEPLPGEWDLCAARIHNIGARPTGLRAIREIRRGHRIAPFHVVQSIWSGGCGAIAVTTARLLGIPGLVHVTGGEVASLPEIGYGGRRALRGRLREALVLRLASAVSATSAPMVEALARLGIASQRVALGVDLDAWPMRAPQPRSGNATARLLHVGSLNRVKDQPTLLRAVAALVASGRELRLDVVGDDTLNGAMQASARDLGLDDVVTFHGFLPQQRLRPLVEAADLLVLASRHEAGPYVLLEAAVAGVPTVGTAVGHLAEWAPEAALAVAVGDSAALAAAIDALLGDEDRRLRIAAAAQQLALAQDAHYTARCFEQMYATLGLPH